MAVQKSQKSKSKKTLKNNATIIKLNEKYRNLNFCKKNNNIVIFCKKLWF